MRLRGREVENISPDFDAVSFRTCDLSEPKALIADIRPAVLVNPRTGRECVGISEMHTTRVVGMEPAASRALLTAVYAHIYAPGNVTQHVWRRGDIVMWDNYTFQHARAPLDAVGRRVLQRVAIGEKSLVEISPAAAGAMTR